MEIDPSLGELCDAGQDVDFSEVTFVETFPIFTGTYSNVYKGICRGELVAIKILKELDTAVHVVRRKVNRERIVWASCKHPNILPLCGYIEDCPRLGEFGGFISPWCVNENAKRFLKGRGKGFTMERRMLLWRGVADGVSYLHQHLPTIVHGDLKPGNILVDEAENPLICDFGLVRIFLEHGHSGLTTTTQHSGTDRYLAPELVENPDVSQLTTHSDVWALGCIGLEFLFNRIPYQDQNGNHFRDIFQDIQDGYPPAARPGRVSREDAALWGILESCWCGEPEKRSDAAAVRESIQARIEATPRGQLPEGALQEIRTSMGSGLSELRDELGPLDTEYLTHPTHFRQNTSSSGALGFSPYGTSVHSDSFDIISKTGTPSDTSPAMAGASLPKISVLRDSSPDESKASGSRSTTSTGAERLFIEARQMRLNKEPSSVSHASTQVADEGPSTRGGRASTSQHRSSPILVAAKQLGSFFGIKQKRIKAKSDMSPPTDTAALAKAVTLRFGEGDADNELEYLAPRTIFGTVEHQ